VIRWCAYCQKYLDETPPYDDFNLTHGICAACRPRVQEKGSDFYERAKELAAFFEDLRSMALADSFPDPGAFLVRARGLGIQPMDLAFGMIQPILNWIGQNWADGSVSVATEHRFSAVAETILLSIYAEYPGLTEFRQSRKPRVLIANAEGNFHTLGIRFLELALAANGIASAAVYPGLPAKEILALAASFHPEAIGISIALPTQLASMRELSRLVETLPAGARPAMYLGGNPIREGLEIGPEYGIRPLRGFQDLIRALGVVEVSFPGARAS
jgi:methanogenic corrinoid protein MtbC1